MREEDTICARATASGEGGIAIVRVSGKMAMPILCRLFRPASASADWTPNQMRYGRLVDCEGRALDEAMAVWMRAPRSYTREDVVEFHLHGGEEIVRAVLAEVQALGARPAENGEFTKRAFLNGRIDLSQAEAVMALISASSRQAARAALRQLEGGPSAFVRQAMEDVSELLSAIEAANDFPDEVDETETEAHLRRRIDEISGAILARIDEGRARVVREGASVALIGKPNVGKSSLLNAFLGRPRAIVTDIPGTTRDVLTEKICFRGVTCALSDTAGLRDSADPVEREGVARADGARRAADVVVLVLNAAEPLDREDRALLAEADERCIVAANQWDRVADGRFPQDFPKDALPVSARTGAGVEALLEAVCGRVAGLQPDLDAFVEERHIQCARAAVGALTRAKTGLAEGRPLDVAAVDLWAASRALSEITGENASERVIDEIFKRFCVGK